MPKISPEEVADILATPIVLASSVVNREVNRVRKKLLGGNPHPISREEAISIVAQTEWAQNWAKSMCRLAGLTPTHPDYESCVERLSRRVAEKVI